MTATALVTVEGVLADGEFPSATIMPEGLMLIRTLASNYTLVLRSNVSSDDLNAWLRINGISRLAMDSLGIEHGDVFDHITQTRAARGLSLLVDASPATVARALMLGVRSLLVAEPAYARPEFRPDAPRGVKAWEDLERAVDERTAAREQATEVGGVIGEAHER